MLTENVVASLIELPVLDLPGGGVTAGLSTADKQVRVLLRDLSGKASWDASILYRTPDNDNEGIPISQIEIETSQAKWGPMSIQPESFMGSPSNLPQRAMRHRPPGVLPDTTNSAPDLDQLDDVILIVLFFSFLRCFLQLLQYLGHTSPECLETFDRKLNEPALPPLSIEIEQEAIASVINQRNLEVEENRVMQFADSMLGQPISRPSSRTEGASSPGYDGSIQQGTHSILYN